MSLHKTLTTLCLFIILINLVLFIRISDAQNSQKDYIDAHNVARDAVGVAPIRWNVTLVAYAKAYANKRIEDSALRLSSGPYVENSVKGGGSFMTGKEAVRLWLEEKNYYHYNSNSCDSCKQCGNYTQVVWRTSVRVGCARVQCDDGWYFVICSYDPPGNVIRQRPY
ncbi:hypothetical protein RND81_14G194000 [Saponaria officinalis]|uniref:SCP domain-containing protein n=1 Tax=Saponaria officinalis TaxID=3572 RepID=A0AAW1GU53_SAPOF